MVILRKTANPSESPIWVSRITRDGEPVAARAMPSSPVDAVITSKPSIERVAASESRVEVVVVDDEDDGGFLAGDGPLLDFAERQGHGRPVTFRNRVHAAVPPPWRRDRADTPLLDCRTGGAGAGGSAVRGNGVHAPGRQVAGRAASGAGPAGPAGALTLGLVVRCHPCGQYGRQVNRTRSLCYRTVIIGEFLPQARTGCLQSVAGPVGADGRRERTLMDGNTVVDLRGTDEWRAVAGHHDRIRDVHLRSLFADDPTRGTAMVARAGDLVLDYSKHRVDGAALGGAAGRGAAGRRGRAPRRHVPGRPHQHHRGPGRAPRGAADAP